MTCFKKNIKALKKNFFLSVFKLHYIELVIQINTNIHKIYFSITRYMNIEN